MIIRPVVNEQEIEQAIELYWLNDPPADEADKTSALAHWLATFASDPQGFWIAKDDSSDWIVGVASSIRRPPQWMLTNFFVHPSYHGQGIGKSLLSQAYAFHEGCERFAVHASLHPSAQRLYMQLGMYPLPYSIHFSGNPQMQTTITSALTVEERSVGEILPTLNALDQQALGFIRAIDHQWWAKGGTYFLAKTEDQAAQPIGYFRVSREGVIGPLVVSDTRWMTDTLELAIRKQQEISADIHTVFAPGTNTKALAYLLAHGYHYQEVDMLLSSHAMPGLAQVIFHDTDFL